MSARCRGKDVKMIDYQHSSNLNTSWVWQRKRIRRKINIFYSRS